MGYEHFAARGDREALVHYLKVGRRYEELVAAGKIDWSDRLESPWNEA